jgi:hypothetical protein
MLRLTIGLSVLLAAMAAAHADDERSEHSASLFGADGDTIGVTISFDARSGWSMQVRPRPGAEVQSSRLDRRHPVVH